MENIKDMISGCLTVLFLIVCIAIAIWIGRYKVKDIREFNKFVDESIGKEIVIQGDTLTIVSYQGGGFGNISGFMLSNGVIVDEKLVKSE